MRTAQAAMRHSKPDLTANVYTDPRLLDIAGAVEVLPEIPVFDSGAEQQALRATGTDDATPKIHDPGCSPVDQGGHQTVTKLLTIRYNPVQFLTVTPPHLTPKATCQKTP